MNWETAPMARTGSGREPGSAAAPPGDGTQLRGAADAPAEAHPPAVQAADPRFAAAAATEAAPAGPGTPTAARSKFWPWGTSGSRSEPGSPERQPLGGGGSDADAPPDSPGSSAIYRTATTPSSRSPFHAALNATHRDVDGAAAAMAAEPDRLLVPCFGSPLGEKAVCASPIASTGGAAAQQATPFGRRAGSSAQQQAQAWQQQQQQQQQQQEQKVHQGQQRLRLVSLRSDGSGISPDSGTEDSAADDSPHAPQPPAGFEPVAGTLVRQGSPVSAALLAAQAVGSPHSSRVRCRSCKLIDGCSQQIVHDVAAERFIPSKLAGLTECRVHFWSLKPLSCGAGGVARHADQVPAVSARQPAAAG